MKKVITLVAVLFSLSATAEESQLPKEMYMPNDAGGFIVLSTDACGIPAATAKGFTHRSYATLEDGTVAEEGCWLRPDMSEAPQIPGVKIIPIVNLWYENVILPFAQADFSPEKKRWAVAEKDVGI